MENKIKVIEMDNGAGLTISAILNQEADRISIVFDDQHAMSQDCEAISMNLAQYADEPQFRNDIQDYLLEKFQKAKKEAERYYGSIGDTLGDFVAFLLRLSNEAEKMAEKEGEEAKR